ncbi:uncharacterized protein BO87DRAFT_394443 [Aspergillus neoniger CBS 115656]|uniref:Uncharacterized protein n=1 Tax=Aspergillus neoniger (strain CBS 115656) TaxID=1448310 RepID=A0A318YSV5_ASPNB|nr:hypothetical protein BO87DRAFT_394443 [Aspergillus neoniger CBS 115656]PYH37476.1 hypothetical protein BO87DRAFT_394443 [Aspergillus neoniger CBS 115656]
MTNNMLPRGHLERIWAHVPHLRNKEKYRMLKPDDFTQEIKVLSNPYCGNHYPFMPAVPNETFGVANELGVQGRFAQSALYPVGEALNHLNLDMSFGDSQRGVNRRKGDKKKKHGRDESEYEVVKKEGKKGTLVPDIVLVEDERHTIRVLCEVKTHWAYGIYTVYEYTWFLKRVDDTQFTLSQPISASSVSTSSALSLRKCLLALVIAGADEERSYYPARYSKRLQLHSNDKITKRTTFIQPPNVLFDPRQTEGEKRYTLSRITV